MTCVGGALYRAKRIHARHRAHSHFRNAKRTPPPPRERDPSASLARSSSIASSFIVQPSLFDQNDSHSVSNDTRQPFSVHVFSLLLGKLKRKFCASLWTGRRRAAQCAARIEAFFAHTVLQQRQRHVCRVVPLPGLQVQPESDQRPVGRAQDFVAAVVRFSPLLALISSQLSRSKMRRLRPPRPPRVTRKLSSR